MVVSGGVMLRVLALLLMALAVPAAAAPPWVADETGETPDPAVVYGELPNGLRYAIMANANPRGVAYVQLRIATGAAAEGPGETEYAHLVEHLAFGPTTTFPKGDAIEALQGAGMQIGRDVGGATTAKGTLYTLAVPQVNAQRLALALAFMRGVGDTPAFTANDLERQKGVVTAEIAGGETQAARARRAEAALVYPELGFLHRDAAARIASVRAAGEAALRAFHAHWYRPDTAFLVVAGDIDPAAVAAAIGKAMGDWPRAPGPTPAIATPAFRPRTATAATIGEPGLREAVSVAFVAPRPEPWPTPAVHRQELLARIGLRLVADRLDRELLRGGDLPLTTINQNLEAYAGVSEAAVVTAGVSEGRWREGLEEIEREVRRPQTGGFTVPEVDRAVTDLLKSARSDSTRAAARTSDQLAAAIVAAYGSRTAFVVPERTFQRIAAIVNAASPDDIAAAYRAATVAPPAIVVTTAAAPPPPPVVAAAYAAAAKTPLPPIDLTLAAAKPLPLPGPPGRIVERREVADLDTTLIRFANGVLLNLKRTSFRTGEVVARVRVGGGLLALPAGVRPVSPPLSILQFGGAGGVDVLGLTAALRGHQANAQAAVGDGVVSFSSSTNPGDLELQLRLWANVIGAPNFDARDDHLIRSQFESAFSQRDATPQAAFARRWPAFVHSDPRFAPAEPEDLPRLTMASLKATWAPVLRDGPIEVTIVGDFDPAKAIAEVAATLGALPERRSEPRLDGVAGVRLPPGGPPVVWTHRGDPGRAIVAVVWPSSDGRDARGRFARLAIGAVLGNRVFNELRQTAAATYTPVPLADASATVPGFGYVGTVVEVAVGDVPLAERVLRTIATSLAETGPTDEEFARVMAPLRAAALTDARSNAWWLNGLDWAQSRVDALDRVRGYEPGLRAITAADVRPLMARIFAAPAVAVRVLPAPPEARRAAPAG
ncbi:MAG: insulinase family protein [Sphingomonadaceae bacterium]|nr:insulinase family protein [Sphingomonadaceae bacterium]